MNILLKKWARDLPAVLGTLIIAVFIVVALFAPWLAPFPGDATAIHPELRLQAPNAQHWFGTDNLGRDILSRVILGTRAALFSSLAVIGIAMLIGISLGLVAGYVDGWVSHAITGITDVFLAVPQLLLALAVATLVGSGRVSAMLALTLTYWPFFTRLVYSETRRLRDALFIDALRGMGAGSARIVFAHILPNLLSAVIVRATIGLGLTILVAASLGFLGVGAAPPDPDWGLAIAQSQNYLPRAWWFVTFPGLAILLTVLGFNLIGDGLRDLVDPRLRRSR
ncbi:MAG: ABC transporter permease [Pseudomonadota bacterium]